MKTRTRSFIQLSRKLALASILFSPLCLLYYSDCSGQSSAVRPKVGLALSGGGACGIAHLGVLKVMEEAGLRPDYITGVSMGSIIGGMYSIGYPADTLEYLLRNTEWDDILSNRIPESKVIFPEKKHFMNSIVSLPVTFKKVKLPSGLINGQQIESMLSFYAWPAADINDFSDLPIPFLCLASDIINNKKIILKSGYLPDAIRASIAVPSLLTPMKIDTMLLIDGGFIRNFAASELKDMGADIIIGSYTGFKKHKAEEVETLTDVVKQIGMIGSLQDYEQQKKIVDVLIEPDVNDYSPARFEDVDSLIRRGYVASLPYKDYFRKLADSLDLISRQTALRNIFDKQYYSFDKIEINGNSVYSDNQILGVLDLRPGEKIDRNSITNRIELLYGKSWFEKVKYRFVRKNDSLILAVDCIERPRAMFYGSLHYDNSLKAGAILGFSVENPLIHRSQLDVNSFIGEFYRFAFDYIQYIDRNQEYDVSFNLYADNTYIPLFKMFNETGGTFSRNLYNGIGINRRLGLNHFISISGNYENLILDHNYFSDSGTEKLISNYGSSILSYNVNTLNSKHFPDNGVKSSISIKASKLFSAKYITDSAEIIYSRNESVPLNSKMFYTVLGSYSQYFTKYRKWTLSAGADFLYVSDSDSLSAQNNCFFLGGIEPVSPRAIPLVGFHPMQLQVTKMAGLHLDIDYEIIEKLHFTLTTGFTALYDQGTTGNFSFLAGAGAGAGYLSVIGPIKVGIMYGFYEKEEHFKRLKGYITIGYNF